MGNSVPDNQENLQLCICPSCPTYKKSQLTDALFCARGQAQAKANTAGCICPNCPVWKKHSLDQMYYCIQGKSADIK